MSQKQEVSIRLDWFTDKELRDFMQAIERHTNFSTACEKIPYEGDAPREGKNFFRVLVCQRNPELKVTCNSLSHVCMFIEGYFAALRET